MASRRVRTASNTTSTALQVITTVAVAGVLGWTIAIQVQTSQLNNEIDSVIALVDELNITDMNITDIPEGIIANLTQELEDQRAILIQKCVDVVELQTLTNQSGSGFSVGRSNGVSLPAAPSTPIPWLFELWDDSNFWDVTNPTEIRLPSSGRYAFGFNCNDQAALDGVNLRLLLLRDASAGAAQLCQFAATDRTILGYCEVELDVDSANYLVITTPAFAAIDPGMICRFTGRLIGSATGSGISVMV